MQLTFREQWLDERLKFDDFGGKYKVTMIEWNRIKKMDKDTSLRFIKARFTKSNSTNCITLLFF